MHFCSSKKFKEFLQNEEIKVKPNQVIYLFNKNTDLFEDYLEYYKKTFYHQYAEEKVFYHILIRNLKYIIKLHEEKKFKIYFTLGRRISKKTFELMQDGTLDNSHRSVLNKTTI